MTVQFRNIRLKRLGKKDADGAKKVVFLAGGPSHGYGSHEHYAGCMLLARALEQGMPRIRVEVHRGFWPSDVDALNDADALVMYCDGGSGHPVHQHWEDVDRLAKKGTGIVCIHYAVEVPKGASGDRFLEWIGGYFEPHWSVNPHWEARFTQLPEHPITRGVEPFQIHDEWYYHMRFRDNMDGVTPILTDLPPPETLQRPDGPHSGNRHVRAAIARGEPQHVAWATERPDGGRGFGFTGGHFHWNWGDNNFRKLMLNAIAWAAKADVPEGGVPDHPVSFQQLEANQDEQPPADFDREAVRERLKSSLTP
jgi:type 1 glutamine amidotransferase